MAGLTVSALIGCQGATAPTPSQTPSPPAVAVFDGITGFPVAYTSEAEGGRLRVTANGYLTRDSRGYGQIFLWPAPDPAYIHELVYGEYAPAGRMTRWTLPYFSSCGLDGPEITDALALMTEATGLPHRPEMPCNVEWVLDPAVVPAGARAVTLRTWFGYGIFDVRVAFRHSDAIVTSARHEAGHVLGLNHSPRDTDLMRPNPTVTSFSADERVQLTMMYRHRQPGNAWPDREE